MEKNKNEEEKERTKATVEKKRKQKKRGGNGKKEKKRRERREGRKGSRNIFASTKGGSMGCENVAMRMGGQNIVLDAYLYACLCM